MVEVIGEPHVSGSNHLIRTKVRYQLIPVFGCKAFYLDKQVKKSSKLEPRALIGYYMRSESTNIQRIWIPSRINNLPRSLPAKLLNRRSDCNIHCIKYCLRPYILRN